MILAQKLSSELGGSDISKLQNHHTRHFNSFFINTMGMENMSAARIFVVQDNKTIGKST